MASPTDEKPARSKLGKKEEAEKAVKMAVEGAGCIVANGVTLSDIDKDITDAEVDAAIERLSEEGVAEIWHHIASTSDDEILTSPAVVEKLTNKEKAEAAARDAFQGTGCIMGSAIIPSDSDDDDNHDDGASAFDDGDFVDGEEAILAMLNEDVAINRLNQGVEDEAVSSPTPSEEKTIGQNEAEVAVHSAFGNEGCVADVEVHLSDGDRDEGDDNDDFVEKDDDCDDGYDHEDLIDTMDLRRNHDNGDDADNNEDSISSVDFADEGDAIDKLQDNQDDAQVVRGIEATPATDVFQHSLPPQDKAIGKSEAEAAARSAFLGTGCVSVVEVFFSEDSSDDEGHDDGDFVDGVEAINAMLDEGDVGGLDQDNDNTSDAGGAPILASLDGSWGLTSPPPEEQAPEVNNTEPKNSTASGTSSARTGSASAASSSRTSDEGFDSGCFQPCSAVLPKSSALLDDTMPMTPPTPLRSPPLSPPQRLDLSGAGDGVSGDEPLQGSLDLTPESAIYSDKSSPLLLQPPPLPQVVQRPLIMLPPRSDIPRAGGYVEAEHLHLFVGFPPAVAMHNEVPLPPSPPPPPSPSLSATQRPLIMPSTRPVIRRAENMVEPEHLSAIHNETPASSPPPPVVHRPLTPSSPLFIPGEGDNFGTGRPPLCMGPSQASDLLNSTTATSPSPPPVTAKPLAAVQRPTMAPSPPLPASCQASLPLPPVSPPSSPLAASSQAPLSSFSPSPPAFKTSPPQPPSPSTFNPLKGMFTSQLDTPGFSSSLGNVLYRGGVMPVSAKARQALKAAGRGEATAETMEAIIRGTTSAHGKANLARDNGGAQFVGPKTRTPTYKTGKGLTRLLSEISKRHEIGSKFVVCLDSPRPGTKAHVITGVVSKVDTEVSIEPDASSAWGVPLPPTSAEALINGDGGGMSVDRWVGANGGIEEGQRLSAWVY